MTDVGGIQRTSGSFIMDGQKYDIDTLIMALQLERAENIDKQIEDQANEMRRRNEHLKFFNKVMNDIRSGEDKFTLTDPSQIPEDMLQDMLDNGYITAFQNDYTVKEFVKKADGRWEAHMTSGDVFTMDDNFTASISMVDLFKQNGLTYTTPSGDDTDAKQTAKDNNITMIKGIVDSLNSSSQLDMIRLQGLMNKRNQAFETMTNILSKTSKTRDNVIANIR